MAGFFDDTENTTSPVVKSFFDDTENIPKQNVADPNAPDFIPGVQRGLQNLQASAYGATALAGKGLKNLGADTVGQRLQDFGMEGYQRNIEEAKLYPAKHTFKDVYTGEAGVGGAIDFVQGTLGELVPSMVEAAGGAAIGSLVAPGAGTALGGLAGRTILKKGIDAAAEQAVKKGIKNITENQLKKELTQSALTKLGGKVGMAAATMPINSGSMYAELLSEKGIDAPGTAILFGALATSLEFAGGNSKLVDTFIDGLRNGSGKIAKKSAKEILSNIPQEALQEGGQEALAILNTVVNTDEELLTAGNVERIIESMAAGAVGGGAGSVMSAATNRGSNVETGKEVQLTDKELKLNEQAQNILSQDEQRLSKSMKDLNAEIANNQAILSDPDKFDEQVKLLNIEPAELIAQTLAKNEDNKYLLNQINSSIKTRKEEAVQKAREEYEALTPEQKAVRDVETKLMDQRISEAQKIDSALQKLNEKITTSTKQYQSEKDPTKKQALADEIISLRKNQKQLLSTQEEQVQGQGNFAPYTTREDRQKYLEELFGTLNIEGFGKNAEESAKVFQENSAQQEELLTRILQEKDLQKKQDLQNEYNKIFQNFGKDAQASAEVFQNQDLSHFDKIVQEKDQEKLNNIMSAVVREQDPQARQQLYEKMFLIPGFTNAEESAQVFANQSEAEVTNQKRQELQNIMTRITKESDPIVRQKLYDQMFGQFVSKDAQVSAELFNQKGIITQQGTPFKNRVVLEKKIASLPNAYDYTIVEVDNGYIGMENNIYKDETSSFTNEPRVALAKDGRIFPNLQEEQTVEIPKTAIAENGNIFPDLGVSKDRVFPKLGVAKDRIFPQFQTTENQEAISKVSLDDIQKAFPGQEITQAPDGTISVRFKNGQGLTIKSIQDAGQDFIKLAIETGQMSKDGKILGITIGNEILLDDKFADNKTLWHENKHVLDNLGIITEADDSALNAEFNKLRKLDKLEFALSTHADPKQRMVENRANMFAQIMVNRAAYRSTVFGKMIQRVTDFFQKLLAMGKQTVSGLAREVESGKIYERKVNGQTYQTTVPQTEVATQEWYSDLEKAVSSFKAKQAPASEWKGMIKNFPGLKQEEIEWTGLYEWLDEQEGKVSKESIIKFIQEHNVQLEEVIYPKQKERSSGYLLDRETEQLEEKINNIEVKKIQLQRQINDLVKEQTPYELILTADGSFNIKDENKIIHDYNDFSEKLSLDLKRNIISAEFQLSTYNQQIEQIKEEIYDLSEEYQQLPKYDTYQLQGGENYKELILTLPLVNNRKKIEDLNDRILNRKNDDELDSLINQQFDLQQEQNAAAKKVYTHAHWLGITNPLAHIRFNERTDADGNKVLFLEEVQSDWHQDGRRRGYQESDQSRQKTAQSEAARIESKYPGVDFESAIMEYPGFRTLEEQGVLKEDAQLYEEIITGTSDLPSDGSNSGNAVPNAPFKKSWPLLAMKRMIRYAAENGFNKIAWTTGQQQAERYGESNIKAEGMKGFYDQMLPAMLNKEFNRGKWGNAKVEQTNVFNLGTIKPFFSDDPRRLEKVYNLSIPITDRMRDKAIREGMPLFQVQDKTQTTLQNVLDQVKQDKGLIGQLGNFLSKFINDSKLNIKVIIDPTAKSAEYIGGKVNTITLRNPEQLTTSIHEITHAVTVREMEANKEIKAQVKLLMDRVANKAIKEAIITPAQLALLRTETTSLGYKENISGKLKFENIAYGLLNEKEFLAQAMGSMQFQELLKATTIADNGTLRNAWDAFVELIMKAVGIKQENKNAFGEALSLIAQLASQENIETSNPNYQTENQSLNKTNFKAADFLLYRKNNNGNYNISFYRNNDKLSSFQNISGDNLKSLIGSTLTNKLLNASGNEYRVKDFPNQPITKVSLKDFRATTQDDFKSIAFHEGFISYDYAPESNQSLGFTEQKIPEKVYNEIYNERNTLVRTFAQTFKIRFNEVKLMLDKTLRSISTRLLKIDPELPAKLRELDFTTSQKIIDVLHTAKPIIDAAHKTMSPEDKSAWNWARLNSDEGKIEYLAQKYNLTNQLAKLREKLNIIRQDAIDVGYDVGFIDEYWPRVIKDQAGFLQATQGISERAVFTEAFRAQAKKLGITQEEFEREFPEVKADIISNLILGQPSGIGGPGNIQARVFETIPKEYAPFYMDADAALMQYIYSMTKKIEARRFFGKVPARISDLKSQKKAKSADLFKFKTLAELARTQDPERAAEYAERIDKLNEDIVRIDQVLDRYKHQRDYRENIGTYIDGLMSEGRLQKKDEKMVRDILDARFHEHGTTGTINAFKNLSYIDTMGSFTSAVTQIGDLAWAMYVGKIWTPKGFSDTIKNFTNAAMRKSNVTKEDLGFERIAQEFADGTTLGNAVSKVFKMVGLEYVDTIGKEVLINNALSQYKLEAKNDPTGLAKKITPIFGKKSSEVVQELLADTPSQNVKLLLYSRVLDFQPAALSEMPEIYLKAGNGRVFYMLKTYTLKQFDVFRREVWNNMKSPDVKQKMQGIQNMVQLMALLTLANATADEIKDWMLGKEIKFSDNVIENFLTIGGASRYVRMQVAKDGFGSSMLQQILPPMKFVNSASKDLNESYNNYVSGDSSNFDHARIIDSIPGIGKLYYWHMGRGSEQKESINEQEFKKAGQDARLMKKQIENSQDKKLFITANVDRFKKMKLHENFQTSLSRNQAVINKLEKLPVTANVEQRIGQLKAQKELILKKYMEVSQSM